MQAKHSPSIPASISPVEPSPVPMITLQLSAQQPSSVVSSGIPISSTSSTTIPTSKEPEGDKPGEEKEKK